MLPSRYEGGGFPALVHSTEIFEALELLERSTVSPCHRLPQIKVPNQTRYFLTWEPHGPGPDVHSCLCCHWAGGLHRAQGALDTDQRPSSRKQASRDSLACTRVGPTARSALPQKAELWLGATIIVARLRCPGKVEASSSSGDWMRSLPHHSQDRKFAIGIPVLVSLCQGRGKEAHWMVRGCDMLPASQDMLPAKKDAKHCHRCSAQRAHGALSQSAPRTHTSYFGYSVSPPFKSTGAELAVLMGRRLRPPADHSLPDHVCRLKLVEARYIL